MENPVIPRIGKNVYIAETSYVGGEVTLGDDCTVMHNVVIRGDVAAIRIGSGVNIQDGTVVHTRTGVDLDIGDDVGIGHSAVVHCRRIDAFSLIGIGSIVLDDCEIGSRCVVAAGCVLAPGTIIPEGKVVMGVPGKIVRDVNDEDIAMITHVIQNYRRLAVEHRNGKYPNISHKYANQHHGIG
ncbi:MAG: gamma carbonic anhydrase family protein [Planctomycetota bacterium]|jgi:carbonic anhydrase/acetyltransferase-like protein (isoleucine patch superfamily)